jgi:hypothetical protein
MTINLTDYIFEMDRADDAEEKLALVTEKFRVFSETARCYLCEEKIGTERWRIGEYTSGNKEVVHQSCWDEEAERASSQESYWCGIEPEENRQPPFGEGMCAEILQEGWLQAHHNSRRGGLPEGKAEAAAGTDHAGRETLEAFASSEGFGTHAGEHGGGSGEPDAHQSWSPEDVAGCGGPIEVRVPDRVIEFTGNNDVTVRVPRAVKAVLAAKVTDEPIIIADQFIVVDKIERALKEKGIK